MQTSVTSPAAITGIASFRPSVRTVSKYFTISSPTLKLKLLNPIGMLSYEMKNSFMYERCPPTIKK